MFNSTINPVIFSIGKLQLRYYGLFWVLGFIIAYFLIKYLAKQKSKSSLKSKTNLLNSHPQQNSHTQQDQQGDLFHSTEQLVDYLMYLAIGAVLGGRLFYCFIYNPMYYLPKLWEIFYVWHGGMSFHGGLIGASIAAVLFSRHYNLSLLKLADITSIPLALGLCFGRIANFINGELVGRISSLPWCVNFPNVQGCRHPSQIYAAIKDLIIFTTLLAIRNISMKTKPLKDGMLFGLFLMLYSIFRFIVEIFRQPDPQIGFILGLTMGQILSIILFGFAIGWMYYINKIPQIPKNEV